MRRLALTRDGPRAGRRAATTTRRHRAPGARVRAGRRAQLRRRARRDRPQPPGLGRRRARRPGRALGARAARHASSASRTGRRTTLLDMSDQVKTGAEQGLLGIAFHPGFADNRRLFLHWSDPRGDTRVAEFRARADRHARAAPGPPAADGRPAGGEPQRRPARVRPRRAALPRARRRRRRIRPARDRAGPREPARQADRRRRRRAHAALGRRPDRPAQPVALLVRPRARRDLDRRRRPGRGRGDRPRAARARRAAEEPRLERVRGHEADRRPRARRCGGELVWPVATYEHGEGGGCSVTGGLVYGGGQLPGLVRRYVYGDYCAGTIWSLRGAPGGRGRGRAAGARATCRCSRTSAPTPTASSSSPRARATSTARCRRPAPDRRPARSPGPSSQTRTWSPGCQAGKPSRRLRSRSPLGSSSSTSWSWP